VKIKKVNKINNFGTFNNFNWHDNCQEFGKYNFFYGWNYSGKTTLSRIFRCLEMKEKHSDFEDAEFSLETDNGNITHRDISKDYPIRVFNEDFVETNFHWNNEDAKIDPVLILGREARHLENKAEILTKEKQKKEEVLRKTEEEKKRKEHDLNNYLTDRASEIRRILGITNPREFDRTKLEDRIKTINNIYHSCILDDNEEKKKLKTYRAKKADQITFEVPQLKLSNFIEQVKYILKKRVVKANIIEKLKENPELSDWVRVGINLHQGEEICQFCGNPLPPDLLERLNKHFSYEFDILMDQVNKKEIEILDHIERIKNLNLPDKVRFFEDIQLEYEKSLTSLNKVKNKYIRNLELLKEELIKKKAKPFNSLKTQMLEDNTIEMTNVLRKIESIIDSHNLKVRSFEDEKQKAKDDLVNHFVAKFIKEKGYFEIREEVERMEEKIKTVKKEIENLVNEIKDINNKIKAEAVGAEKINGYLRQFFNDDKLRIETTEDGKYKIYRNNRIAKNLSTGEKNIISLVYFFTKLEETGFDFDNAIIFIDDPVSSLDSNHIFKVYGFINEKLKNCGQLFITTHNFDFFNLLKDLSKYDLNNKGKFYLVKKVKNQTSEFSFIENLPDTLFKYKSEYNYLFSILKSYKESNDKSNFQLLYLLPNILRRFFEAYLFMKYPDGTKFSTKAKTFFKNTNISNRQKTLKLMDEYSHEENPTHSRKFPDIKEVEDAVVFILQTIKEKDKEHYEALCKSLRN